MSDPLPRDSAPPPRRFPRQVFTSGAEPDVRFSLANERTFLAWIRTSLALIAAGTALEVLGLDLHPGLRLAAAVLLVATGTLVPAAAWWEWMAAERALRRSEPLPHSLSGLLLALVISVVGGLILLAVILR